MLIAITPFFAHADTYGDNRAFNVDKSYDNAGRAKLNATLLYTGAKLYIYVDDLWWSSLNSNAKTSYNSAFQSLDTEFAKTIYPKLTTIYGSDINPQVNRDGKITILVHPMVKDAGGYINTGDGYPKQIVTSSNEREWFT